PLDSVGVDMVEVDLTSLSPLVGGTLAANPPPEDLLVVAVVRGDDVLLPRGATQLCAGDRVVIGTRDQERGLGRAEAWVRGEPRDLGV
ncbi:MAG: Trk K+ transport system NAD-binding subunit, partial [Glaciecola sp.]